MRILGLAIVSLCVVPFVAGAPGIAFGDEAGGIPRTRSPKGAAVYIISPENGATVTSPVTVRFGLKGMGVAPAGVQHENTGHHHLIIDAEAADMTKPLPSDEKHRHFGGGQTEVELELAPGPHMLQLILADHLHVPHDPPVISSRIAVVVEPKAAKK